MTATCQWCEEFIKYGNPETIVLHTSSNFQSFVFCNKRCARDWLMEICK